MLLRALGVLQGFLIVGELFTDVTGEEIISSTPSVRAIGLSVEVHIDNATQIACEFFFGLAGKRGHILHIHLGFFCDRNSQSFRSRVNRGHDLARLNGTLGEHIRFAFEVVVLVENFQGAKKIIGAVVCKGESVATAVNQAVFCYEFVVEVVQFSLGLTDRGIRNETVHLLTDELLNAITKLHHTLNTLGCRSVQFGSYHAAVFSVVNVAVHYGVAVVLYVRVCMDRSINRFAITEFGKLGFGITALDILNSVLELNIEVEVFIRLYSKILSAVLCAFRGLSSKHHFGVVDEIAVYSKPVIILAKMHPIGFNLNRTVSLLQEDDVRHDFRSCVRFESVIRQADSTEQVGSLCDILSHFGRLLIHCVARCYKCYYSACPYLV